MECIAYILADKASQAVGNEYDGTIVLTKVAKSVTCPLRGSAGGKIPTVSSFSRCVARAASKFLEWLPILFFETTARQSRTCASYPNVRIRARGSFVGNSVWGQGATAFSAVHVFSRCPVRPWMKTTLKIDTAISKVAIVVESSSKASILAYSTISESVS